MTAFQDVMLDLETLGTRPGCKVLSIGAVAFNPEAGEIGPSFHVIIDRRSQNDYGLEEDPSTLDWWERQSDEAKETLRLSSLDGAGPGVADATSRFAQFLGLLAPTFSGDTSRVRIWGNGSDFDQPIVAELWHRRGVELPWNFYNNRCYRTLKNLARDVPMPKREGTHHNAVDDAYNQAVHTLAIFEHWRRDA